MQEKNHADEIHRAVLKSSPAGRWILEQEELRAEAIREATLDDVAEILGTTIVNDEVNKRVLFLAMLLTYTAEDQQNLAFNAPSSTGKSYLALQIASFFPKDDVMTLGYTSPRAFFHELSELTTIDGEPLKNRGAYVEERLEEWEQDNPRPEKGVSDWREKRRATVRQLRQEWDDLEKIHRVNLEQKILVFVDQPHDELLRYLRSLLSHDQKTIRVKIVDKTKEGGNKTKTIDVVGYPTLVFNSARFSLDDQERTRLLLLSPEMTQQKLRASLKMLGNRLSNRQKFDEILEEDRRRRLLKIRVEAIKASDVREILLSDEDRDHIINRFLKEHPTLAPRLQRDLPRLIALIKAYALLNCFTRERTKDGQGIWASQRDVEEGYRLYSSIGESNELGIPPQIHKLWMEAIKPVLTDEGLTRKDLARLYFEYYTTRVGRKQLAQTWELLCEVGLVMEQPDPNDRRIMRIYPPEGGGEKIIQGDSAGEDLYKTSSPLSGGIYSDPIPNLPKPELSLQEDLEKLIENVTSLQRRNRSNDPIPKEEVKQDLGWEEDYFNRVLKIIVREKRLYETPDGRIGVSW